MSKAIQVRRIKVTKRENPVPQGEVGAADMQAQQIVGKLGSCKAVEVIVGDEGPSEVLRFDPDATVKERATLIVQTAERLALEAGIVKTPLSSCSTIRENGEGA